MYEDFFRLKRKPFSIAPDPGFLFLSDRHREALAHLMYGLETEGGFVLVTGEVGTGKTTLIRSLIDRIPAGIDVAFILNPRLTAQELLETLCQELGITEGAGEARTVKQHVDRLTRHLLRTHGLGRSTVMIIDEAQNLSPAVLEQIRLLTNLETNEQKLLRIILLGQPELAEVLDRRDLRQLAQRITARYHLSALDPDETRAYLAHRLSLAGGSSQLFTRAASRRIYRLSGGIPRLINVIADRALLGAYVEGKSRVGVAIVSRAGREVLGGRLRIPRYWVAATIGLVALVGGAWAYLQLPAEQSVTRDAPELVIPTPPTEIRRPEADIVKAPATPAPSAAGSAAGSDSLPSLDPEVSMAEQSTQVDLPAPTLAASPPPSTTDGPTDEADVVRPADLSAFDTLRLAYAAVFARWELPMDPSDIPCNVSVTVGLQCLRQTGGWNELIRHDRPAVLELWDSRTDPFYSAVLGVEGETVRLQIGSTMLSTSRRLLEQHWYGNFVVLWRMPPHYRRSLKLGDDDATVGWLRQQLSRLLEADIAATQPNRFDQALYEALVRFQRESGLIPDGIAGPATWIALGNAAGERDPRLREES